MAVELQQLSQIAETVGSVSALQFKLPPIPPLEMTLGYNALTALELLHERFIHQTTGKNAASIEYIPSAQVLRQSKEVAPFIVASVYKAKDFFDPRWSPPAQRMVEEARKSFQRAYGSGAPKKDIYDAKSAVYLVKITEILEYEANQVRKQRDEWFSMRAVPSGGVPKRTEDLDYYGVMLDSGGYPHPIHQLMAIDIAKSNRISLKEARDSIITLSRFSVVNPFITERVPGGSVRTTREMHNLHHGLAFALMNRQLWFDLHSPEMVRQGYHFTDVTLQIHDGLKKLFGYPPRREIFRPTLTTAAERLGVDESDVSVMRNKKGGIAYEVPKYFLEPRSRQARFNQLVAEGMLNPNTPGVLTSSTDQERAALFATKGKIKGTMMTGEVLRWDFNRTVLDYPTLYWVSMKDLGEGADLFVHGVGTYEEGRRKAREAGLALV